MANISPSILTDDTNDLVNKITFVMPYASLLHIDVMDGHYVDSLSLSIDAIADAIEKLEVPHMELHLMVKEPLQYIDSILRVKNITSVIIHSDAVENIAQSVTTFQQQNLQTGISFLLGSDCVTDGFNPDFYLVLAEEKPGYGGTGFSQKGLDQIRLLKSLKHDTLVEVDGGMNNVTGKLCLDAGADRLAVNSYIFKSDDPISALQTMQNL